MNGISMKITSPAVSVALPIAAVYEKLENVSLFQRLMPENLAQFSSSEDNNSFSFTLKGMPEIFLEKKKHTPTSELVYGAPEGKLPFTLSIALTSTSAQHSEVVYTFEGEFNPMLALVVKSPITKLLQTMAEKTKTL